MQSLQWMGVFFNSRHQPPTTNSIFSLTRTHTLTHTQWCRCAPQADGWWILFLFKPPLVFSRLCFNPHPSLLFSTAPALITPFHVLGHPYWFTFIFLGTLIFFLPSPVLPLSLFHSELRGEALRDVVCRRSRLLEYCQTRVFMVKQRISAVRLVGLVGQLEHRAIGQSALSALGLNPYIRLLSGNAERKQPEAKQRNIKIRVRIIYIGQVCVEQTRSLTLTSFALHVQQ